VLWTCFLGDCNYVLLEVAGVTDSPDVYLSLLRADGVLVHRGAFDQTHAEESPSAPRRGCRTAAVPTSTSTARTPGGCWPRRCVRYASSVAGPSSFTSTP